MSNKVGYRGITKILCLASSTRRKTSRVILSLKCAKKVNEADSVCHCRMTQLSAGQGSEQEIKTKDLRAELEEKVGVPSSHHVLSLTFTQEKKHFDSRRKGEALPQASENGDRCKRV